MRWIKKVFGIPPEVPMAFLPSNAHLLVLESTRRLPLETTVVSKEGEELTGERLDPGHTLTLSLCSAEGPAELHSSSGSLSSGLCHAA